MKYIGQILTAIVYTCIFTGIMYYVITLPLAFFISLPWWGMILFILVGGGIIEGIIQLLGGFGIMPYMWIAKKNIIATVISIILVLLNVGLNTYYLWSVIWGNGSWPIIFGIIATVMLLQFVYVAIIGIIMAYHGLEDES